jgi:hypothetical protein
MDPDNQLQTGSHPKEGKGQMALQYLFVARRFGINFSPIHTNQLAAGA